MRYKPKHKHVHEWTYRFTGICWIVRECRCGEWELM
jgi:hypothetical protein